MPTGNPNDRSKLLNFVAKVYDPVAKAYKPIYEAPDATNSVYGDVLLSDATNSELNAATGVTAATPKAVKTVNDALANKLDKNTLSDQTVASKVSFNKEVVFKANATGNLKGNASTATTLQTGRKINVKVGQGGTGSATFNGAVDVTIDIPSIDASRVSVGTLPLSVLPQGALEKLVKVANKAARFNLTTKEIQLGDSVLQLDTGVMYIVVDQNKLNSDEGYQEYKASTALLATEATKLGHANVGTTNQPIYLTAGVPSAISKIDIAHGGTNATTVKDAANQLQYSSIGERTIIPAAANLNTYKTVGSYICPVNTTITNKPEKVKNQIFTLDVVNQAGDTTNYIRQIFRCYNDHNVWERLYKNNAKADANFPKVDAEGWTSWTLAGGGGSANSGVLLTMEEINVSGATVNSEDTESSKIIQITSSATTTPEIFTTEIEELQLGAYSVILRTKINNNVGENPIFKITVSSIKDSTTETLKTVNILPKYYLTKNKWECLSFGVNFTGKKGSKLKIVAQGVSNSGNITYSLDYIKIIPSGTALTSIG